MVIQPMAKLEYYQIVVIICHPGYMQTDGRKHSQSWAMLTVHTNIKSSPLATILALMIFLHLEFAGHFHPKNYTPLNVHISCFIFVLHQLPLRIEPLTLSFKLQERKFILLTEVLMLAVSFSPSVEQRFLVTPHDILHAT